MKHMLFELEKKNIVPFGDTSFFKEEVAMIKKEFKPIYFAKHIYYNEIFLHIYKEKSGYDVRFENLFVDPIMTKIQKNLYHNPIEECYAMVYETKELNKIFVKKIFNELKNILLINDKYYKELKVFEKKFKNKNRIC